VASRLSKPRRRRRRRRHRLGLEEILLGLPLGLVAGAGALLLGLDTPIGHRLIADALEGTDIGRGVRLSVARIEGSIYGGAAGRADAARSPRRFLRAGEGTLDWRPLEWFARGLVIRDVAAAAPRCCAAPNWRHRPAPANCPISTLPSTISPSSG
jgi:translocation and assembly module TamB